MNQDISSALSLMAIGMITVFAVLALVVLTGNLLIRLVNRWTPDPITPPTESPPIHPDHFVAIAAAVEVATHGKGKITKIERS